MFRFLEGFYQAMVLGFYLSNVARQYPDGDTMRSALLAAMGIEEEPKPTETEAKAERELVAA